MSSTIPVPSFKPSHVLQFCPHEIEGSNDCNTVQELRVTSPHASSPICLGRTYHCRLSVAALTMGDVEAVAVGNRSGAFRSAGSRPSRQHAANSIGRQSTADVCAHPSAFRRRLRVSLLAPQALVLPIGAYSGLCDLRNASTPSSEGFESAPICPRGTSRARGTLPQHILQITHSLAVVFANIRDSSAGAPIADSMRASAFWDSGSSLAYP